MLCVSKLLRRIDLKIRVLLFGLLFIISTLGISLAESVKGVGVVKYEGGGIFSSKANDIEKQDALDSAKLDAWNKYVQHFSTTRFRLYQPLKAMFLGDLDQLITNIQIVAEADNEKISEYKVVVKW